MLYDLLNKWPLELAPFWLFVLFFAGKFIRLGQLGFCGRGIPITSSRWRWGDPVGRAVSTLLIAIGAAVIGAFFYWLIHAIYVRFVG